jgi:hypothetical protein
VIRDGQYWTLAQAGTWHLLLSFGEHVFLWTKLDLNLNLCLMMMMMMMMLVFDDAVSVWLLY